MHENIYNRFLRYHELVNCIDLPMLGEDDKNIFLNICGKVAGWPYLRGKVEICGADKIFEFYLELPGFYLVSLVYNSIKDTYTLWFKYHDFKESFINQKFERIDKIMREKINKINNKRK